MKKEIATGKLQAAPCPMCGHYMEKVVAYIDQDIKHTGEYTTISFNIITAWVCRMCMQVGKP